MWFKHIQTPSTLLAFLNTHAKKLAWACALFWGMGLALALVFSPADYQQGQVMRILYIHVPASWGALAVYTAMAIASAIFLIWRAPVADLASASLAPIGAVFTGISLITGMLWGKPMWGAYWVWDARLTSMLLLGLLYIGYIALRNTLDDIEQASKSCACLAVFGWLNIPVIKGSVYWWTTLHQPSTIFRAKGPAMPPEMLLPLGVMTIAWILATLVLFRYSFALVLWKRKWLAKLSLV